MARQWLKDNKERLDGMTCPYDKRHCTYTNGKVCYSQTCDIHKRINKLNERRD